MIEKIKFFLSFFQNKYDTRYLYENLEKQSRLHHKDFLFKAVFKTDFRKEDIQFLLSLRDRTSALETFALGKRFIKRPISSETEVPFLLDRKFLKKELRGCHFCYFLFGTGLAVYCYYLVEKKVPLSLDNFDFYFSHAPVAVILAIMTFISLNSSVIIKRVMNLADSIEDEGYSLS